MGICICQNKNGSTSTSALKPNPPEKERKIEEQNILVQRHNSVDFLPLPALDRKPTSKRNALNNQKDIEMAIYKLKKIIYEKTKLAVQYKDKEFLPNTENLIPKSTYNPVYRKIIAKCIQQCSHIKWLRCNAIYGFHDYRLFMNSEFNPEEIIQGSIASSYFLVSVIAIASNNPVKFQNIFELCEIKEKGIYAMKFFIQGMPKIIVIDDYIPCKLSGNIYVPAFSHGRDKETCVMLLEKAWTKLNMNSYMKTWIGTPQEAQHALCEAPCISEIHKSFIKEKKEDILWTRLKEADKNKWFMTTITEKLSEFENIIQLPEYQAFAILGVYEMTVTMECEELLEKKTTTKLGFERRPSRKLSDRGTERRMSVIERKLSVINEKLEKKATPKAAATVIKKCVVKLLKLRNPSGNDMSEFKGQYCDRSKKWTEELRRETGFDFKKPGTFFLTLEEYLQFFLWTFICKYMPKYVYNYAIFNFANETSVSEKPFGKSSFEMEVHHNLRMLNSARDGSISNEMDSETLKYSPSNVSNNMSSQSPLPHSSTIISENGIQVNLKDISTIKPVFHQQIFPIIRSEESSIHSSSSSDISDEDKTHTNRSNELHFTESSANDSLRYDASHFLKVYDNHNYTTMDHLVFASFELTAQSRCYLTLHQPQARFHSKSGEYKVPVAFFILVQYEPETHRYTYVASEIGQTEKLYIDKLLTPGQYHIYAKNYWTYPQDTQLVVSTYSEEALVLYQYPKSEIPTNWIQVILIDLAKKNSHKEFIADANGNESNSFWSYVPCSKKNLTGFGIFYYENNSPEDNLEVKLVITKSFGIIILNGEPPVNKEDDLIFRFRVSPKNFKCLIYQINSLPWQCEVTWKHQCWLDLPDHVIVSQNITKETTTKVEVAEGLTMYEVFYDRGYIMMIDNLTEKEYKWTFCFTKLMKLRLDHASENEEFEILSKPKQPYFIGVKSEGEKIDPSLKPVYEYKFAAVSCPLNINHNENQ